MEVPAVGDVFAGKYAIEAIVGRGGMGIVLGARHLELDERVAIKLILAEEGPKNADFVARFLREARLASKIKSEHVVRILDVAHLPTGEPYIVMELLEGKDLAELLRGGPLPIDQAALFLLQACEALAEAHALGIIHRDLKPANLFLTTRRDGQPCVKVLDFGISKLVGPGTGPEPAMTQTNALMGSPMYMSPDQLVQSKNVDARSDIWALGVILFELLTARCPFDGLDAPAVITQILYAPHIPLGTLRSDAPPQLSALVDAALTKDRAQRLPDVAEFAARLAAFAPEVGRFSAQRIATILGRPSTNPSGVVAPAQSAPGLATPVQKPVETTAGATLESGAPRPAGRRAPVVIAALAVLGAAAVGAAFLTRANRDVPVSPVPSQPTQAAANEPAIVPEAPAPVVTVSPAVSAPAAVSAPEPAAPPPSASAPVLPVAPGAVPAARESKPRRRPGAGVSHPATPADPFGGVR